MTADPRPLAVCLMGPTASGKTDLAIELLERAPGGFEIVSVDSAMIYRGMDIGTAKPDAGTLARAPHRLIDLVDPAESYSAGRFRRDALAAMDEIRAAGRVPLLVGGTMFYFRALAQGLAELPEADAGVRAALDAELAVHGAAALHAQLAAIDPVAAARIHPNDPQRVQRALEVWRLSGRTLSDWHACQHLAGCPYRLLNFVLLPADRGLLHARIEQRFDRMLACGFIEEVARLRARADLHPGLPAMRAVGYRQVWEHLDGLTDRTELRQRGIQATRQYARRQLTWLRGETGAVPLAPATAVNTVLRTLGALRDHPG